MSSRSGIVALVGSVRVFLLLSVNFLIMTDYCPSFHVLARLVVGEGSLMSKTERSLSWTVGNDSNAQYFRNCKMTRVGWFLAITLSISISAQGLQAQQAICTAD